MPDWLTAVVMHPITLLMFGGGVGTNARYWLGKFVAAVPNRQVPVGDVRH